MNFSVAFVFDIQLILNSGELIRDSNVGIALVEHGIAIVSSDEIVFGNDAEVDVQISHFLNACVLFVSSMQQQ